MTLELSGTSALVTGATSGIGKATAMALAEHGVRVVLSGRDEVRGKQVVEQIRAAGGEAYFVRAELHDEASARALAVPSTRNPQRSAAAARSCVRDATGCRLVFRHRHRPAEPHAPGRSQHRRPVTQARPR
jgi:NAD(P)-dependent dehydrogenase (short-subunit alcohol dehydrogenase family)